MSQAFYKDDQSADMGQALNTQVKCPEERSSTKDNNHPIVLTLMKNKRESVLQCQKGTMALEAL
jgi:hypothetical protein